MWPAEKFLEVAKNLSQAGYQILFTGSAAEKEICETLAKGVSGSLNLAGLTSLSELHALYSLGRVVISNDSSPLHLAAMAGVATVAIFGATTLELGFRPWSDSSVVAQIDLDCRPCGLHGHKKCPLGHHNCMKNLPAEIVINATQRFVTQP
jgi:heptosyltransferase-2